MYRRYLIFNQIEDSLVSSLQISNSLSEKKIGEQEKKISKEISNDLWNPSMNYINPLKNKIIQYSQTEEIFLLEDLLGKNFSKFALSNKLFAKVLLFQLCVVINTKDNWWDSL